MREWEEEQVKLDRDWYTGAEEGTLIGDEEHNPLAQYEDLSAIKDAEIAKKQAVRSLVLKTILVCDILMILVVEKNLGTTSTICKCIHFSILRALNLKTLLER